MVFWTQDGESSVEIDGPEVPLLNAGSQSENYSVISAILPWVLLITQWFGFTFLYVTIILLRKVYTAIEGLSL